MQLKKYLNDNKKRIGSHKTSSGLLIFNKINGKNIDLYPDTIDYKYGIYIFELFEDPSWSEILIRRGDKYEILEMQGKGSLMNIMIELIAYFHRHPDVPKELYPIYVEVVTSVYNDNRHWYAAYNLKKKRRIDTYGDWHCNDTKYRFIVDSEGEIGGSIN
jgi:hypothetical protein